MVFNSALFFLFFAGVLLVYLAPLPEQWRRGFLLLANYVFFASYYPPYVLLLAASTCIDWWLANRMGSCDDQRIRLRWLWASVVLNIGTLSLFKYVSYVLTNMKYGIYHPLGAELQFVIIPVGVSFYTFQALSYTIDVYRRRIPVEPSLMNFALFVSFFPHFVAGPILRARDILPQCQHIPRPTLAQFSWGCHLLLWGLIEKCLLADLLVAPIAQSMFDNYVPITTMDAWVGVMAFTLQIFFDFAGYSTCAIGVALCLGFVIPLNFRFPLGADGFVDFWHRWHISLSTWFRDYVYITLGGNRQGRWQTHRNTMITMMLGGLWHGFNITYLIWGTLLGAYIVIEREVSALCDRLGLSRWSWSGSVAKAVRWVFVLYGLMVSLAFFRSYSITKAWYVLRAMHGLTMNTQPLLETPTVVFMLVLFSVVVIAHRVLRNTSIEALFSRCPGPVQVITVTLLLLALIMYGRSEHHFLYVQF